jgi:hypothetical protein
MDLITTHHALTHVISNNWDKVYQQLEKMGEAGDNALDAQLFPGSPYTIATLDTACAEDGIELTNGVTLNRDSAIFWANKWLTKQGESLGLLQTTTDALEKPAQQVENLLGIDTQGSDKDKDLKPFYKQTWFYVVCGVAALGIVAYSVSSIANAVRVVKG